MAGSKISRDLSYSATLIWSWEITTPAVSCSCSFVYK
uniref:Uncharacterized protein n=1 Tax=Arundo donax TaxID=35708 RepID=A0A0A9G832_ARUDO